ncbi:hypothetical protein Ancab_023762 [Ancistrocladus abbreviatus]
MDGVHLKRWMKKQSFKERLDFARVLIHTTWPNLITGNLKVKVDREEFVLFVVEESPSSANVFWLSDIASSSGQRNCPPDFPANSTSSPAELARDQSKLPALKFPQKDDEKSNDRDSVSEPNGASPQKAISFGSHKAILECSPALVDRDGPNPCPNIERPTATNDESENGNYEPPKPTDKMGLNYESQLVAFFPNTEAQPKASSSRRPRWKSVTAILNVTPRIYRRHKKKSSEDSRLPKG